jgi:hypothetical protein
LAWRRVTPRSRGFSRIYRQGIEFNLDLMQALCRRYDRDNGGAAFSREAAPQAAK